MSSKVQERRRERPPATRAAARKSGKPSQPAAAVTVYFVSPAYGRYSVSDIVFEQRGHMVTALRSAGVDARALIVADDNNLKIAQRYGLETLDHPNLPLGRKLNAGIEHAYRSGATHVCFIGSDSMALPACFERLAPGVVSYGRWYTLVERVPVRHEVKLGRAVMIAGGLRVPVLDVPTPTWALNVYPRELLGKVGGRPVDDTRNSGLDGSIRTRLGPYEEVLIDVGPYQVVSLRTDKQITSSQKLVDRYHVQDGSFAELVAAGYAQETVARIEALYNVRRQPGRRSP